MNLVREWGEAAWTDKLGYQLAGFDRQVKEAWLGDMLGLWRVGAPLVLQMPPGYFMRDWRLPWESEEGQCSTG